MSGGSPFVVSIGHEGVLNDAPLFLFAFGSAREGVKVNISTQPAVCPSDTVGSGPRCSANVSGCSLGSKGISYRQYVQYFPTLVHCISTRVGIPDARVSRIIASCYSAVPCTSTAGVIPSATVLKVRCNRGVPKRTTVVAASGAEVHRTVSRHAGPGWQRVSSLQAAIQQSL